MQQAVGNRCLCSEDDSRAVSSRISATSGICDHRES